MQYLLDSGELDTLYQLYNNGSRDDGEIPSKDGLTGLIEKGLAEKNYNFKTGKPNRLTSKGYVFAHEYYTGEKYNNDQLVPYPIMNVDLDLKLRKMGHSDYYYTISTDEGDGYSVFTDSDKDRGELNTGDYLEWIGQLETIITYLKRLLARNNG